MNRRHRKTYDQLLQAVAGADEITIVVKKGTQTIYVKADWLPAVLEAAEV